MNCVTEISILVELQFYAKVLENLRVPTWRDILYSSFFFIGQEYTIDANKNSWDLSIFFLLNDYANYNTCYEFIHVTKSE